MGEVDTVEGVGEAALRVGTGAKPEDVMRNVQPRAIRRRNRRAGMPGVGFG